MEWSTPYVISLLVLLGGGVAHWVTTREEITRLKTKVEALEQGHNDMQRTIREGFENMRREVREDISSLRDFMEKLFNNSK